MELYISLPKHIETALKMYERLMEQLESEFKKASDNFDTEGMLKISYDVEMVKRFYKDTRAEYDPYYKRATEFKGELFESIDTDNMTRVLEIADYLGHSKTDICNELGLNKGNVSACAKGQKNRLSRKNRVKIYDYIWRLAN